MRAIRYHEHGNASVLRLDAGVPEPTAKPGGVVVGVEASSVNPLDTYLREGGYAPAALPMIPGVDVAGVVENVGPDIEKFEPGDRVFGTGLGRTVMGANAESVWCPLDWVAHLPDDVSFETGGAVGNVAATAWQALFRYGELAPGETCLVHGASGGVGHAAVQLARSAGASVVGTARPEYHDRVRDFGADIVFDYDRDDLSEAIRREVGGVDTVLCHRMDDYLQLNIDVGRDGVRIVSIGGDGGTITDAAAGRGTNARIQIMSLFNVPRIAPILERLAPLLADDTVTIAVDRSYPLTEVPAAHDALMTESFVGKLAIEV